MSRMKSMALLLAATAALTGGLDAVGQTRIHPGPSLEAMIEEYKRIKAKKSNLRRKERDSVVARVEAMVQSGKITDPLPH